VFLPGWEEGLFPSQRTMDEHGIAGLEEERRLAYVGLTRARKRAYVSYAGNRRMYGNTINAIPSRFVDELPPDTVESGSDSGIYNPGRSRHWDSKGFQPLPRKPVRSVSPSTYKHGDEVYHDSFGRGRVVHVDGRKLDILFEDGEQRRVMDSFVSGA
jgi:DNA helicase-2/ATP-dependent DNA helicase PcrA